MIRAGFELAIARLWLSSSAQAPQCDAPVQTISLNHRQAALIERVAYVIPRIAARLPWRTDCLVQALAAKRWLGRNGIMTTMTLGVPKDQRSAFAAHAWLVAGDRIVTGGDISAYVPLTRVKDASS